MGGVNKGSELLLCSCCCSCGRSWSFNWLPAGITWTWMWLPAGKLRVKFSIKPVRTRSSIFGLLTTAGTCCGKSTSKVRLRLFAACCQRGILCFNTCSRHMVVSWVLAGLSTGKVSNSAALNKSSMRSICSVHSRSIIRSRLMTFAGSSCFFSNNCVIVRMVDSGVRTSWAKACKSSTSRQLEVLLDGSTWSVCLLILLLAAI